MTRRLYLDWLRGLAVLIMIEGHTLDSWTRLSDHSREAYGWAMILAGFGAPIFLFLAGVAIPLAAGARIRRGLTHHQAATRALRRGVEIFILAFAFRAQSWLISGGAMSSMLKVDILNIMGLSMLAAALLWRFGTTRHSRSLWFGAAAILVAMATPLVRSSSILSALPDIVEWYIRPAPHRTTFALLPWGGFLLVGAAVGAWLEAADTPDRERRVNLALIPTGVIIALAGYAASFLPPIYPSVDFWTSSPTFFFLRVGVLIAAVPMAYFWGRQWAGWSPLREMGVASLFVYWIHVEMVYGVLSTRIHRALTLEQAAVACALFALCMLGTVVLKRVTFPGKRHGAGKSTAQLRTSGYTLTETS